MIDFEAEARYRRARKIARLALECGDEKIAIEHLLGSGMDRGDAQDCFVDWKAQMATGAKLVGRHGSRP